MEKDGQIKLEERKTNEEVLKTVRAKRHVNRKRKY